MIKGKMSTHTTWLEPNVKLGLVSVIIPLYNRVNFIIKTLESIDKQTYRPIECIIVDDGSTDDSKKLTTQFIQAYKGSVDYKYVYKSNSGVQATRNHGTRMAQGEFIQYLDSDDILFEDKFKMQVQFLNDNDQMDAVFSPWAVGESPSKSQLSENYENLSYISDIVTYFRYGPIVNFSPLMRISAIAVIGIWDEQLTVNEELDYHVRFLLADCKLGFLDYNSGLWREHDTFRLSSTNQYGNLYCFYRKHEKLLKSKNVFSSELSDNFGLRIFWKIVSNSFTGQLYRIKLMFLAARFSNNLPCLKSKKVKIIKIFLGKYIATLLWFYFILPSVSQKYQNNQ